MPRPASAKKPAAPSKVQSALRPPDERFWIRYSRHHELPVSVAGSFLLHVLGVGLIALIIIGALSGLFGNAKPVEVQPIQIVDSVGGGGGNPLGVGTAPNTNVLPTGTEAKPPDVTQPLISSQQRVTTPDLKPVNKNPEIPLQVPSGEPVRVIPEESTEAALGKLTDIGKMARARIDGILAGKGKGGPGSGGGLGSGEGTGTGGLKGPGGNMNKRTERQLRWVIIFPSDKGQDYLRALQHFGAIVAVPQLSGDYMVFRDLAKRPLRGQVEDIQLINRIYWVDDKPRSVAQLAEALGIFPPPPYIAAFFPENLEPQLRNLEEKRYRGPEDNIEKTHFHVTLRGGKYEVLLVTQPRLKGQ